MCCTYKYFGGIQFLRFCLLCCACFVIPCFACRHDPKLAEDRVFLKAKRFIPKDTEIFVGYGTTYWKIRDMAPHVMLQPPAQDQQAQHAVASPAAHAAAAAGQGSPADVLQDGSPTADQQTPLTPAQDSSSSDEDEEDDPELTAGSLALTYSVSMEGGKRRLTVCPTPIPMQQPADSPPGTPTAPQQASPDRANTLQDGSTDWQAQLQGGFERMTISKPARGQQHAHALQSAAQESNPAAARSSADCSSKQVPSRSNFPVQQQPKPSSKPPAGPSSAAAAGSSSPAAARTMLGLCSGFAAAVIPSDEAAELYISPDLLDSESEDDDGSWTPGYKPKKNTEQRCAPNSSRRLARRRRVPNPDLAYNGTWQAAKPIEKW